MFINKILKQSALKYCFLKRCKHKDTHWSIIRKKQAVCDRALEHFDEFYDKIFDKSWPAIRQGLLKKQKYIAVVNNFSDADEIKTKLEINGALNIRTLFNLEKQYISDNYKILKRKKYLQQIWKADKDIDDTINTPTEIKKQSSIESAYQIHSLEKNLLHAEVDVTRIISSDNAANLYEFVPVTKIKGKEDWIPETVHYKYLSNPEFSVNINKEYDIHFPEYLNAYCYEIGNHSNFLPPRNGSTGVLDYYLMDGGSLLPVLALDVKPEDNVLDMCASPGGKSYLILQTLYPNKVTCNDISKSRIDKIYNVMRQYLYDFNTKWLENRKLHISLSDGRQITQEDFDKILVDVPCTTDRHSLKEPENNIFRADRTKERLTLPELQCELLVQALKLVRVGGTVVYSTCSLSPVQNDGVVHMALKQIWEETSIEVVVKDLSAALLQTTSVYKLADQRLMKYGHLVVPNLHVNFGPTYFCKLQRLK